MAKIEKVARVTSASVEKGTGKSWDEWVKVLNKAGAKVWSHQEIVAHLKKKHKLTLWWQQGVAVGYEVATGKRIAGQNGKGEYSTVATRTFPLSARELWKLISSPDGLALWLKPMGDFMVKPKNEFEVEGGIFGEVRTMKAPERIRMTWQETDWPKASVLNVAVIPRDGKKSVLVFQHDGLRSARQREDLRAYWKARIEELLGVC